ncbi:efflux RND transporter periplasmic adaptor subunit, partial [Streptomyces sp. G35A]
TAEALAAEERLAELLSLTGTGSRPSVPRSRHDPDAGPSAGPADAALTAEELDRFADDLRDLLDAAVSSAERQLFELRTAAADDARILGALGDGGLLPPGPDVLATVEFLGEHGIPALPGWRYLAQAVDPADHARVLAARPELVDGVIITDPDSHVRAREALSDAALLPRSAVAVGTAAALLAPTPPPDTDTGDVFLVPPNPAMHDEHAADEERQALRARATARDEEIRALAARLGKDRELAARLASWRTGCPAGRLAELARAAHDARVFAEESEAELAEARVSAAQEARAQVAAIEAQLESARLDLSFTRITAPIDGQVGRAEVTAGNLVNAGETLLTSLVSTDKVYAYFEADERIYLKYRDLARQGDRGQETPVYLGLTDEQGHPHLGHMDFMDNHVDPRTGTIRGRAIFDNREGLFTPGLYARLKLVGSATYDAMLIQDEAIGTDLGKKFVLVLKDDGTLDYRAVTLGPKLEGLRIVRDGLAPSDRIVVNGLQRVRPGMAVQAE